MRLVLCAVSAVALSGCSWLGGLPGKFKSNPHQKAAYGAHGSHQSYNYGQQAKADPCQIFSPQQPIPRGCHPSQVTIATGAQQNQYGATNGFPQQPQFGQPNYATKNYGSHANVAHQQGANHHRNIPSLRKPKFRGSLSLGAEKSFSGDVFTFDKFPIDPATGLSTDPTSTYLPNAFAEQRVTGTPQDGQTVTVDYFAGPRDASNPALWDEVRRPNISFDDAWSTPTRIAIGGEYILSPKNTVFANAGYTAAEGRTVGIATVEATIFAQTTTQGYDDMGNPEGAPGVSTAFVPNQDIAIFSADFTDMKRYDLEVGGRHYFDPLNKSSGLNTITPFVGASVGASHYNSVSYRTDQDQRFYERAFLEQDDQEQFYNIDGNETQVQLYDSQWVPSGQLNVGAEWQVTPRTGLAIETGLRVEGARKYLNDEKGDTNIAIPFTIRGSYNF